MGAVPVRTGSVGRSGRLRRDPPLRALRRCRRRVRWRVTARPAGLLWLATSVVLTCAAVGAAVVLAPRVGGSPDAGLAWMLFVGSSLHVAATGWLFTDPGLRAHVAGAARSLPVGPRRPPGNRGAPCGDVEPAHHGVGAAAPSGLAAAPLPKAESRASGLGDRVTRPCPHCGRTNAARYARPVPQVSPGSAHIRHCSNWTSGCHSRDTWRWRRRSCWPSASRPAVTPWLAGRDLTVPRPSAPSTALRCSFHSPSSCSRLPMQPLPA